MPIRSGIGIGEAQVFDTGGVANQFAKQVYNRNLQLQKQYEQQQKEQAKVADDMSSLLAKYSTKGLKDADIKLIGNKYQEVKDMATKASTTKDPTERAKSVIDAKAGMQSISEYVDRANNNYDELKKITADVVENGWRYEDGVDEVIKKLYELPIAQWGEYSNLNPTMFQRKPDTSSLYAMVDDVHKDLESVVKYNPEFLKTRTKDDRVYDTYVATPEQARDTFLTKIQVNPKAKFTLDAMYKAANPNKPDHTDLDLAQFATDNLYNKKPGAYSFAVNPRDTPKEPAAPKDSESEKETKLWENYTQGAFNPNTRNQYIKNLQILAGDKAKLSITPEGYVKVIGSPEQKLNVGSGLSVLTPAPAPKEYIAKDPSQLIGHLKNVGVTPKGISSIERLNKANNTSTPSSSRRAQDGYRINQVEGGYKYIGGPADDKNSWVQI